MEDGSLGRLDLQRLEGPTVDRAFRVDQQLERHPQPRNGLCKSGIDRPFGHWGRTGEIHRHLVARHLYAQLDGNGAIPSTVVVEEPLGLVHTVGDCRDSLALQFLALAIDFFLGRRDCLVAEAI